MAVAVNWSALPTGGADPRNKIPVITAAAQKYGVDPAVGLRVAQSEGLRSFYGDGGRSGTAFQLYTHGGLGNEFQKETGLNPLDPKNEDAAIDWAMKNVARTGWGPYKGAAKVGIGPRQGIGVQTAAQPGQQPAAPVGTSPVADEGAAPAVEQPAGGDISKAPFMAAGATPSRVAANNVQTGPSGITLAQQQPEQATTAPPGMEIERARMLRDKQQKLQRASEAAASNPYSPKGFAERIQRDADVAGEQAKQIEDFNSDRSKQQYGADLESQKEDLKLKLARSDKLKGGIEAASRQFEGGDRDTLRLARSALNDPAMWTGAGAERTLDLNRVRAIWGNTKSAQLQEMLEKVTAQSVLSDINAQRDQMEQAGGGSSRLFSQQADLVRQTSARLGTSLAGNRALVEIKLRNGELSSKIAQMERDYLKTHRFLDSDFDQEAVR